LFFADLLVELTLHQPLAMPERVHHVHGEHQVIEGGGRRGGLLRRSRRFEADRALFTPSRLPA
jgi:hypothetical protein